MPKLESMLTRSGLFGGGNEEERFHAALALAWIGSPVSLAVLNRERDSKRDPVRRAVEGALEALRAAAARREPGAGSEGPPPGGEEEKA